MTSKTCPVCGAAAVVSREERRAVAAPLGPSSDYLAVVDECHTCGEKGDFAAVNDPRIVAALRDSELTSIVRMLDDLAQMGISNASLERALRLPQRTTSRWKEGKVSAGAAALLRILRTYPWLIEVADSGFKRETAAFTLVREAGRLIANFVVSQVAVEIPTPVITSSRIAIGLVFDTHQSELTEIASVPQTISTTVAGTIAPEFSETHSS